MAVVVFVVVVMGMAVQRQRPLGAQPEQRAVFRRGGHGRRRAVAADMPVQADHPVRGAHHHMQVVADHQHAAAQRPAQILDDAVEGGGAGLVNGLVQSDYTTTMLLIILAGKFLFTLISYGCGTPGGFFLPMLVLGALIGAIFANIMISSQLIAPAFGANVIILSMAAFFSSSVRAPITGTLLILEMTGSFQHMMVLAVASATAYIVAELLGGEPIYEALLMKSLKSKATHETRDERNIIEVPVCSGSSIENKRVSEIPWPEHTLLLEIKRDDKNIIVGAETRIRPGDFLYVLTESIHAPAVLKLGEEIVPKRLYGDF